MTDILNIFERLTDEVEKAIIDVEANKPIDFTALHKEIMAASASAQSSDPAEAQVIKTAMGKLIMKLDELAAGIKAYQQRIQKMH